MTYLPFAIAGYFLNSITMLVDKALINKSIPNPLVYTFYLGIMSQISLLLIPFGFYIPASGSIVYALLSGVCFVGAWVSFFHALKYDEATRVAPLVGTINPIFTLAIGFFFLSQTLSQDQLVAFGILVFGMATLSSRTWFTSKLALKHFALIITSGFLFAISSVFLREAFLSSNFVTGLIISRAGMGITCLAFLLSPTIRQQVSASKLTRDHFVNKTSMFLLAGQVCGALGGLLLTYSVSLVNPALVSALHGTQYIFLILGVLLVSKKYRHLLDEDSDKKAWAHKIAGSVIIGFGLAALAFNN